MKNKNSKFRDLWEKTGKQYIIMEGKEYPVVEKEEWDYKSESGNFIQKVKCIDENIFYFYNSGTLTKDDASVIVEKNRRIYDEFVEEAGMLYIISNVKEMKNVTRKARQVFIKYMLSLHRPVYWVLIGGSFLIRGMIRLAYLFNWYHLHVADSLPEAYEILDRKRNILLAKAQDIENNCAGHHDLPFQILRLKNRVTLVKQVNNICPGDAQVIIGLIKQKGLSGYPILFHLPKKFGYFSLTKIQFIKQVKRTFNIVVCMPGIASFWMVFENLFRIFNPIKSKDDNSINLLLHSIEISHEGKNILGTGEYKVYDRIRQLVDFIYHLDNDDEIPSLPMVDASDPFFELFHALELLGYDFKNALEEKEKLDKNFTDREKIINYKLELLHNRSKEVHDVEKRLRESEKFRSVFVGQVSFEFRSFLDKVTALVSQLEKSGDKELGKMQDKLLPATNRLMKVLQDLEEMIQIESGTLKMQKGIVSIHKLLEREHAKYLSRANKKNLSLSLQIASPENDYLLETDKAKLVRVLDNLLDNALLFTEKGEISIGYTPYEKVLEFFVKDTGITINLATDEHVFESFVQDDIGHRKDIAGVGLGLTIAKSYVEFLGGNIWFQSIPGQGTEFYFTVPLVPDDTRDIMPKKRSNPVRLERHEYSALIVEDDPMSMAYFTEILKPRFGPIYHARNGKEAVGLAQRHPGLDIVIMDVKIPLIDGFEATRQIKKIRPGLPVIIQTAFAMNNDEEKARLAGCDDYIQKPVNKQKLNQVLDKFIGNSTNG